MCKVFCLNIQSEFHHYPNVSRQTVDNGISIVSWKIKNKTKFSLSYKNGIFTEEFLINYILPSYPFYLSAIYKFYLQCKMIAKLSNIKSFFKKEMLSKEKNERYHIARDLQMQNHWNLLNTGTRYYWKLKFKRPLDFCSVFYFSKTSHQYHLIAITTIHQGRYGNDYL